MKTLKTPKWKVAEARSRRNRIIVICAAICLPLAAAAVYFASTIPFPILNAAATGRTIQVRGGEDFQKALNQAASGDTIMLQAGATFSGNFVLPRKTGEEFITIRSSAAEFSGEKSDTRVNPAKEAVLMPKLVSPTTDPVLNADKGSHHFRFVGVEFGGTKNGFYNIIQIGTAEETRVEDIPHHIEFDRVYIHATAAEGQRRGIAANGRHVVIKNSHISGIRRKGEESQAIAVWGTDGPVEIVNNYLEAAAENILFGGASSKLKLVPSNCIVRGNTLNKPVSWRNEGWLVKNLFEIKNGRNIKVTDNVMTNNWVNGQDGTAVLFTVREDNGHASIIEGITFENNVVRGSGSAVNVWGGEGGGGRNLTIRNNLFADINHQKWGGRGMFLKVSEWDGLTIENNTIINSGNITMAYGKPVQNFVFQNNIVINNEYGMTGDDVSPGREALMKYFPRAAVVKNIIVGGNSNLYGPDNFYLSSIRQVGFTDETNYRLNDSSPYLKRGVGGKEIGYRD